MAPKPVRVGRQPKGSRHQHRMIEIARRKLQTRLKIRRLEIWQFLQNLRCRKTRCEQVEDIAHPNAHAAHTGSSATLFGVNRNPFRELIHVLSISIRNVRLDSPSPAFLSASRRSTREGYSRLNRPGGCAACRFLASPRRRTKEQPRLYPPQIEPHTCRERRSKNRSGTDGRLG